MNQNSSPSNTKNQNAPQEVTSQKAFINKWSWGGFFLPFVWALGSKLYGRGVLYFIGMFVPIVNLIMMVVVGKGGRKKAWQSGKWEDLDAFKDRQKILDIVGIAVFVGVNLISFIKFLVL